jgi:DNA polymerase-3 subunit beta
VKITVDTQQLNTAIAAVAHTCPSRSPHPFHQSLRIHALGSTLTVRAFDGETWAEQAIPALVDQKGVAVLNADRLAATVKTIATPTLTLAVDDTITTITASGSRFRINASMDANDYPTLPPDDKAEPITIAAGTLEHALKSARHAMSTENSRYAIHGMLAMFGPDEVRTVATDGRRLVVVGPEVNDAAQSLIPANLVAEVIRATSAADPSDRVTVRVSPTRIGFDVGDWSISGPQIAGAFPPYADIIKGLGKPTCTISGDTGSLLAAIKAASIFAEDENPGVTINVGDHVEVRADSPEVGSAEVVTDAKSEGKGSVKVNAKFIRDAIPASNVETVIEIVSASKPVAIRGHEYIAVVMPLSH